MPRCYALVPPRLRFSPTAGGRRSRLLSLPRARVVSRGPGPDPPPCRSRLPDECCGLLLGEPLRGTPADSARVTAVEAAANHHPHPRHGYDVDPRALLAATAGPARRAARWCYYHSHPAAAPVGEIVVKKPGDRRADRLGHRTQRGWPPLRVGGGVIHQLDEAQECVVWHRERARAWPRSLPCARSPMKETRRVAIRGDGYCAAELVFKDEPTGFPSPRPCRKVWHSPSTRGESERGQAV
jgi:hypothetical protein